MKKKKLLPIKIAIWLLCFLLISQIQPKIELLFTPEGPASVTFWVVIVDVGLLSLAAFACSKLSEHQAKKSAPSPEQNDPESPVPDDQNDQIITTATAALEELEAQAMPDIPAAVSSKAHLSSFPLRGRKKMLIPVCVLAFALLLSLGGNVYQYLRDNRHAAQIQALNTQLQDADTKIAALENQAEDMEENRDYYRNLAYERELEADEHRIANNFFYSHIAFVIDDGTNLYHSYRCSYVQSLESYTYWAYNIEAAEDYGYTACPLCKDNFG